MKTNKTKIGVQQIVVMAMMIAIATVLSNIKPLDFWALGGSVTLFSMLVICLVGYWYGLGPGLLTGLAYGLIQLLLATPGSIIHPIQLILDYILGFTALGLSGLFKGKKYGLILGFIVGITGRYICSVISGAVFFGEWAWEGWNVWAYSLVYNMTYIYIEGAITVAILLIKPVRNAIDTLGKRVSTNK